MLTGTIPLEGLSYNIIIKKGGNKMSKRHKRRREYTVSNDVFDTILKASLPASELGVNRAVPHGYQYGCNNIYHSCEELTQIYGKDNSERLHSSGLFFVKGNNGVVLNKYPFGVRKITILKKELDGYHYPKEYGYKVFYFHEDQDLLLEIEVDPFLYTSDCDDGYYLFQYDPYRKTFVEMVYDEENKRLVEQE